MVIKIKEGEISGPCHVHVREVSVDEPEAKRPISVDGKIILE
jgi:hypothetical protein